MLPAWGKNTEQAEDTGGLVLNLEELIKQGKDLRPKPKCRDP